MHERPARPSRGRDECADLAHRLGTVRDAGVIAVLDGGRAVEHGDHDHLLAVDGIYARLFTLQAQGYRRNDLVLSNGGHPR